MQGFLFGQFTREHFLKLLGSVMNNIEHNLVDIVSATIEGSCSGVDQGWICYGVPTRSLTRDCSSLLYE